MTHIEEFTYDLPPELIAQHPLERRTDARLMVVHRADGALEHFHVRDLPRILQPGDALFLNNTRVLAARLVGVRELTGGRWHGLYVATEADGSWRVLAKTRGKIAVGETVMLLDRQAREHTRIRLEGRLGEGEWRVRPLHPIPIFELLNHVGRVPLPHYIRDGEMLPEDVAAYQTVFASQEGSVAAPTAGLHFTHELLQQLQERGVHVAYLTLHVGPGTFRPIVTQEVEQHKMHAEWGVLDESAVQLHKEVRSRGGRIIAVGTTSTRLLESAAGPEGLRAWSGPTELYIYPGHRFRGIDALMTNFHLPRSTLLVLVSAFAGRELLRRAYAEAIQESYRFYSYGDAMLIL